MIRVFLGLVFFEDVFGVVKLKYECVVVFVWFYGVVEWFVFFERDVCFFEYVFFNVED